MDAVAVLMGGFDFATVASLSTLELVGVATIAVIAAKLLLGYISPCLYVWLLRPMAPKVVVHATPDESAEVLEGKSKFDPARLKGESKVVHLWDPSTFDSLGEVPAMTPEQVDATVARAKVAQQEWRQSSFLKRRLLMRTFLRFFTENQEQCARVAVRDSGKVCTSPSPLACGFRSCVRLLDG